MSKRLFNLFLQDIIDCIERIEKYTEGYDRDKFIRDEKTGDAVIRNLEIIGEAARNIPQEVKNISHQIPWKKIIGFRNIVIHEYYFVDLQNVWFIIEKQLPQLKVEIQKLLKNHKT